MASLHWSLADASTHCGVSKSTLKRRLADGDFPNAVKTSSGAWTVPVTDLIGAGLQPGRPSPPDDLTQVTDLDHEPADLGHDLGQGGSSRLEKRISDLEHDLGQEQERVRSLTQANADLRSHIDDLRTAMRMLEPGPTHQTEVPPEQPDEGTSPEPTTGPPEPSPRPRRRFLARLFNQR